VLLSLWAWRCKVPKAFWQPLIDGDFKETIEMIAADLGHCASPNPEQGSKKLSFSGYG
jgi:hypothetical protein